MRRGKRQFPNLTHKFRPKMEVATEERRKRVEKKNLDIGKKVSIPTASTSSGPVHRERIEIFYIFRLGMFCVCVIHSEL